MNNKNDFINFEIKQNNNLCIINFELSRDLRPEDLKHILPPDPVKNKFSAKGVVLSGRGPIWLYGYLIHFYHPTKFVAVYDPRLDAAVVVESHTEEVKVGDLISIIL
jgi:CRISPR-associated protein Csx3